jgi:glycosyltransferase involved in cell wall biosynthesis
MERAEAVLVSTPDLLDHAPAAMWLPNPVDCEFFGGGGAPATAERGNPEVLIHARLSAVKGAETLIAAAREIRRRDARIIVRGFAGAPFDDQAQAAGIRLQRVSTREGVRNALADADVVIGQQYLGMVGLSELEAMAMRRPVIAPIDQKRYPHPVPTVAADNAESIADRVIELVRDDRERARLGAAGRAYVEAVHSPPVVVGRLVEIYERIVSR